MSRSRKRRRKSPKAAKALGPRESAPSAAEPRRPGPWRVLLPLLAFVALAILAARFLLGPPRPLSPPRNLVLVSIDTMRPDQTSVYGGEAPTPHLERLARDGVLFEDVQTVAPLTLPAHASLFTASWPFTHGVRDNVGFYLHNATPTLASHLRDRGYRTGGFVSAFVLDSRFGIDQGFEHYADGFDGLAEANDVAAGFVSQRPGWEAVSQAREWIESVTSGPTSEPFFAFVHLFEPHTPYDPPAPHRPEGAADSIALYRGELAHADALVGELVAWLDDAGFGDDTLVVVTSDHGESLGDHGELTHGLFVYESTVEIPLILRYPGSPRGIRVRGAARIIDVAPTVLELMGWPSLEGAEGTSLVSLIDDTRAEGEAASDLPRFSETFVPRLHYGWSELRSYRRGKDKLILAPTPELYDLEADPQETDNLYERYPETARRLTRELLDLVAHDTTPVAAPLDRESRQRLQSLGYLGGDAGESASGAALADPKERLEIYHALNDPGLMSLEPSDGPRFEEALALLRRAIERDPAIPRAHILYGELLLKAGRPAEAERTFETLVGLHESFEGFYGLGMARQQLGDLDGAEESFRRARTVEPRNTKSHFRLSEIASARGDVSAAEDWLLEAIEISPNRALREKLATLYLSAGRQEDARRLLAEIRDEFGDDAVGAYNLAQSFLVGGDAAGALEMFRVAAELDPADPDVQQGMGTAHLALGDPESALEAYGRAVELSPCFAAALANSALAHRKLGRLSEAQASLERAITCEPNYVLGYRNLAAVQLESGALDAAIETLTRARNLEPGNPEVERELEELIAYRDRRP